MMGPIEAISNTFSKTFVFSGRSPRSECWWYLAFAIIIYIIYLITMFYRIFSSSPEEIEALKQLIKNPPIVPIGYTIIYWVLNVIFIIQCLSLNSRRLHDIGLSGWWQFLYLIIPIAYILGLSALLPAFIFIICTFIICCLFIYWYFIKGSEDGDNQYGPPYNSLYDDTESTQNYINSLRKTKTPPQDRNTNTGHVKSKSHPEFKPLFGSKKI